MVGRFTTIAHTDLRNVIVVMLIVISIMNDQRSLQTSVNSVFNWLSGMFLPLLCLLVCFSTPLQGSLAEKSSNSDDTKKNINKP